MDDSLASLTSSDNWWGTFLVISTLVVLMGVAGEAVIELTQWLDAHQKVKRFVEVSAVLVLIVGVAGELLGEGKTISIGDQISGRLNVKAGEANERAAKAEKEASEANERAEELYNNVKQRQLWPKQVSIISSALLGKIPQLTVIRTKDPASSNFAVDIFSNLNKAGLPIGIEDKDVDTVYCGFSNAPLILYLSDPSSGMLISKAFNGAGIALEWDIKPNPLVPWQPPNSLYVSLKAPPLQSIPAWAIEPKK